MIEPSDLNHPEDARDPVFLNWLGIPYRPDLAFPKLSTDMLERLRIYGWEETVAAGVCLYSYGDRNVDLYIVLEGGIDIILPDAHDGTKVYNQVRAFNFSGELNLLNSQGVVVEAKTIAESRLLRIPRARLKELMRDEGDIANLIVQACIWRRLRIVEAAVSGVILKGHSDDPQMTLLRRFLLRNMYPHRVVEVTAGDGPAGSDAGLGHPLVQLADGRVLNNPTIAVLADELGITELPDSKTIYDVAVVGAGPGGLAAAVYAASEGLSTLVIEAVAPGGQAGTSSKIENYLGFPTGIGGQQLAIRAQMQALKFGVEFAIAREVATIDQLENIHRLHLAGGHSLCTRSVVVATGAQYRTLNLANHKDYENRGLYYAATAMEGMLCRNSEVVVVGGGNSAGQASLFLSGVAKHVHHVVRGPDLSATMSQYLISRIVNSRHITLYRNSEVIALEGHPALNRAVWLDKTTGEQTARDIGAIFVMIGAEPNTGWLYGTVQLDRKGFILTGRDHGFESSPYATSMPGIFAVGDVRANSVKRVASAVGEGSVVISDAHRYLAAHSDNFKPAPHSTLGAFQKAAQAVG